MRKNILFVLTSCTEMGDSGRPTGFHLGETVEPWRILEDAGFEIDVATMNGRRSAMVGYDPANTDHSEFLTDVQISGKLNNPLRLARTDPERYAAVYFVGGHGAMWDFHADTEIERIVISLHENGGVISAICHGQAALVNIKKRSGEHFVSGRRLTSFSHEAEKERGLENVVPFSLQHTLEEHGAHYTCAPGRAPHVVADGRLITGQNPASASELGRRMVTVLTAAAC
jgi:putative intracellular protease/amidase